MGKYTPTKFKLKDSYYDKNAADRAVNFIECLCHTKGKWAGEKFKLMPWQENIIRDIFGTLKPNGKRQFNTAFIEIPKKCGKQLDVNTPIPTPSGWTTMGDIKVGDTVFDENGHPCHVVAKSQVDDTEQAYRLVFRDGSEIVAGENHLWDVEDIYAVAKHRIMKTKEIYDRTLQKRASTKDIHEANRSVIRIRVSKPIETDEATPPVDPYLYGYWLGNGSATKPNITISDADLGEVMRKIPYKTHNLYPQTCGGSYVVYYEELKPILVSNFRDKKIPIEYLRASVSQRWALLQGLMDSDGSISKLKAESIYVSTIEPLAKTVSELLWSLGIKNAMKTRQSTRYGTPTGETLYEIRFTTFSDQPTAGLGRKNIRERERQKETRSCFHYLADIEPLSQKVRMQCIQVDSGSHCYLAGPSMVPTHNSELAAAVALYLLYGDNEPSAEVYGAAADRQQASIVFDVANQMVQMCPALMKRSKIKSAAKRIENRDNNGFYQVLSADVANKHGFSVSGLVLDEVHAQPNRKLYDVLTKGSGDAREQPLFFLITTAGNDVNSICYELHQKAKDILEGRKHDPTFYPVIFGADMEDDWSDPKVWKKANPSLGVTITIDKVRAAFESARQNPAEENSFRQLRLNQWVKQAVRWMPMDKWDACKYDFDESDLYGRPCYGGLDLSSSTDISAFVLVFPPTKDDENYYILPYFWIPEENMVQRVNRDHVNYDIWNQQGYIETTEGNVIHYGYIEAFIDELGKKFNIKEIAFDRWGAIQMTQDLDAMGYTVIPFGQGFKDMSSSTKELMNLVLAKQIRHDGHPVLHWMMDNVCVRVDPAGNIKMDKSKSTEKIDGAVALVMALDRALRNEGQGGESVYDSRGIIFI